MQTIVEAPQFRRAAKASGMAEEEVFALVDFLAANPDAGDVMKGTGGFRKLRWARPGKGKSGGYRVITFFSGANIPLFLIDVYTKSVKDTLTGAEANQLKAIGKEIVEAYGKS